MNSSYILLLSEYNQGQHWQLSKQVFKNEIYLFFVCVIIIKSKVIFHNPSAPMERHLIKTTIQPECKILLKHFQHFLEIILIPVDHHNFLYKLVITNNKIPEQLNAFFETIQQLFEFLKSLKPEEVKFVSNSDQVGSTFIPGHKIQFQISAAKKTIKKSLTLTEYKASEIAGTMARKQIEDFQKLQQIKRRVQQKNKKVKALEDKLSQITLQILQQEFNIMETQKQIQEIYSLKQCNKEEMKMIPSQIQVRKVDKVEPKISSQIKSSKVLPGVAKSASKIQEALPKPCSQHPFSKNIKIQKGKKTLQLKNKEITDTDIKGMIGYKWDEIQSLYLAGNKLTNQSLETLRSVSKWPNVTQLYLSENPITDISKITCLQNLQFLSLYGLQLNESSCDFLIKAKFPKLKTLHLNFAQNCLEKCWKKIAESGLKNLTSLESISIDNPLKVSSQTRVKLNKLCAQRKIKMQLITKEGCLIF